MSPPKRDWFEIIFEAIQAVVTLTFFCLVTVLGSVSDEYSLVYKLIFNIILFFAIALICFLLTKKWKLSTVLWFLIIAIFLTTGISLMV